MICIPEKTERQRLEKGLSAEVESLFEQSGTLYQTLRLEYRPQQVKMAYATACAFEKNDALIFEAGTGVGKSLAYLLPGILMAMAESRPFVVSSHTIALQEQIRTKDLEGCRNLFRAFPDHLPAADFKVAMLVGRANYLCTTRLERALRSKIDLFGTREQAELERIRLWASSSQEGLIEELTPPPLPEVWDWVNADAGACNPRACMPERCFFRRARARLRKANVVIVNHSLLFALLGAGAGAGGESTGVLLPQDFVVLDEAHTVPEIATEHFGLRLSAYGVTLGLKKLFNPKTRKGLLKSIGRPDDLEAVVKALQTADVFFEEIREHLLQEHRQMRLRQPPEMDTDLALPLKQLAERLADFGDKQPDAERDELRDHSTRLLSYGNGIDRFLMMAEEDHVHWVERSGRHGQGVALRTAPLEVAPYLKEHLFSRKTAVVLTSATLATGNTMESFCTRVGASSNTTEIVSSPFDFRNNMRVFIAEDAPLPGRETARLDADWLADTIAFCANRTAGGSLVLFTSYADMYRTADALEDVFASTGRPFYVQGREQGRSELTRRFREAGNAVLFGADSFWTGIDVPGPALSQVVITRLPFENPVHPIAEAKSAAITQRGGSPFLEMTLPEAVIQFRQGVGRLIRKKSDRGLITILDTRILTRTYGRDFIGALPQPTFRRFSRDNREQVFQPFQQELST